jgi:AcrR family transcriptional regulator
MARFAKEDWLELGARLLGDEGPAALTIERMTAAAARTRGSFYHHFKGRDDFLAALMKWWARQAVDAAAARFAAAADAAGLRKLMRQETLHWDMKFERNVRQLGAGEPLVADALRHIDEARMAGMAMLIAKLHPEIEEPQMLAFVQYAAIVGGQWLLEPGDARIGALKLLGDRLFGIAD